MEWTIIDMTERLTLITFSIPAHWQPHLDELMQSYPSLRIVSQKVRKTEEISSDIWQQVEILFTFRIFPMPEQAPNLRWIQLYSAGANQIIRHPIYKSRAMITTASGSHAVSIGEYVMSMILAWYHCLPQIWQWQQERRWPRVSESLKMLTIEEIRGKTVGIVGYGSIGREVARMAQTFGMRIIAMQRSTDHHDHGFLFSDIGDPEGIIPECYYAPEQFHELLSRSDVVVITVPLTQQTTHLFDAKAFNAMKPTAFLVNIARGEICDQEALIQALRQKRIAGAALDVATPEPLPPDNPLWSLPNVMISPHVSGVAAPFEDRILTIFAENMRRYLAGEPTYNLVDKELNY
jgi:phosphoglycerate dehydrogenase-like enzyme